MAEDQTSSVILLDIRKGKELMIQAAVFDLDHTLFDRYATQKLCMQGFCEHFEVSDGMTDEIAAEKLEYADRRFNHLGWDKILDQLIKENVFKVAPTLEAYSAFLMNKFKDFAVPYEFTKPMLEELRRKGLKIGLITNGKSEIQRSKINRLGIADFFDEIIISGELGVGKPNTKPFEVMAQRLGIQPQNMIYVGDFPVNDIEASRKAGYIPVWVMTMKYWLFPEIEVPEFCIKDVSKVPEIIEELNKR